MKMRNYISCKYIFSIEVAANSLRKSPDTYFEIENNGHYVAKILHNIRIKTLNNVVIGLLNINSLGVKFDRFKFIISEEMDITVIVETKLDETYPDAQFYIKRVIQNHLGI